MAMFKDEQNECSKRDLEEAGQEVMVRGEENSQVRVCEEQTVTLKCCETAFEG